MEVPSQERLAAELNKALALPLEQQQRVKDVLDLHARRMAELLAAPRDDCFAERKERLMREFLADLLACLTAEQQIELKATPFWKRMTGPLPVRLEDR